MNKSNSINSDLCGVGLYPDYIPEVCGMDFAFFESTSLYCWQKEKASCQIGQLAFDDRADPVRSWMCRSDYCSVWMLYQNRSRALCMGCAFACLLLCDSQDILPAESKIAELFTREIWFFHGGSRFSDLRISSSVPETFRDRAVRR